MELLKIQELLHQAFDHFNKELCEGSLPKPIITILSRGARKRVLGWMWAKKWQSGEDIHHEISISAETIDRPFEDVMETLTHEMVHLYNAHAKINDCNPAGRHNKKFKKTAEEIFKLEVHNDPKLGWAYTNLTDESRALIEEFKKVAIITEWSLKRLDPVKPAVEKVYVVPVSKDQKDWLKEHAQKEGIKPKELLEKIIGEYKKKVDPEEVEASIQEQEEQEEQELSPADSKLLDDKFEDYNYEKSINYLPDS